MNLQKYLYVNIDIFNKYFCNTLYKYFIYLKYF